MALFTFKGEVEMLADPQIKLVESVLQKRGFKSGNVLVEAVGKKGDNYMSLVKKFIYATENGSTFKMIGKVAPTAEKPRMLMNTAVLFKNESAMYNLILPKLNNLQLLPGIDDENKSRFPICYGVVTEEPYEFILLEDLTESGFVMLDRFQPLANETVKLVLKDLAIFHSLSYVLKNNEPEDFESFTDKLDNMWILLDNHPDSQHVYEAAGKELANLLLDESDRHRELAANSFAQRSKLARLINGHEKGSKYNVIQQGDCWNNNILFRLEDGKPVQDVMIDYQVAYEGHPASDLLYFIFNCTDHASRLKHYHEWIAHYHECLDQSLNNHGLKANRILPKDVLDAGLRRYGNFMVSLGIMLSSILVKESKDALEIGGEDPIEPVTTAKLDIATASKLKERIMGIIDSAIEFELI